MNTMAARIGGYTLHSWGEVPFDRDNLRHSAADPRAADDISSMFVKCQSLRFIIIDEIENAGAEVLAVVEAQVRQAIRLQNSYKRRPHERIGHTERSWGGVNLALYGDMWQLPPVLQTPMTMTPSTTCSGSW